MMFRLSLRKKLIYTFLGGSLLTVLLFGLVLKGIMNDYFQRLAEVRLQFVSEQGQREIRTNVAIFKDAFQDIFRSITIAAGTVAQSGVIGDHLPESQAERNQMANMVRALAASATLTSSRSIRAESIAFQFFPVEEFAHPRIR